jgi:cytochrome c oxidase cbb3-type subunit 4
MNSGVLSGIFTAILLVAFIGIVAWAWSSRRRSQFEAAAQLPLEEDRTERS